jgi:hypothetical protein
MKRKEKQYLFAVFNKNIDKIKMNAQQDNQQHRYAALTEREMQMILAFVLCALNFGTACYLRNPWALLGLIAVSAIVAFFKPTAAPTNNKPLTAAEK